MKKLAIIGVIALVVIGCVLAAGCTSTTDQSSSVKEKVVYVDCGEEYNEFIDIKMVTNETDKTMICYVNENVSVDSEGALKFAAYILADGVYKDTLPPEDGSEEELSGDEDSVEQIFMNEKVLFKDEQGNALSRKQFNLRDYTLKKVVFTGLVNDVETTVTIPYNTTTETSADSKIAVSDSDSLKVTLITDENDKTLTYAMTLKDTDSLESADYINYMGTLIAYGIFKGVEANNGDMGSIVDLEYFVDEKGNSISPEDFNLADYTLAKVTLTGTVKGVEKTYTATSCPSVEDLSNPVSEAMGDLFSAVYLNNQ